MIAADKQAHLEVSAVLTFVGGWIAHGFSAPVWPVALAVLALGAAREIAQLATSRSPVLRAWADVWRLTRWAMIGNAEWGDMAANAGGVALGWGVLAVVGTVL